jgi:hypothetical protein
MVSIRSPPEQDVGRRLHHSLPFHDALSVLGELSFPEERLEYRGLRFLELEEQRVVVVAAHQQQDPGTCSDTADTDHLPSGMDVREAFEQLAPIARHRARVGADHAPHDVFQVVLLSVWEYILDRCDEGRVADDP